MVSFDLYLADARGPHFCKKEKPGHVPCLCDEEEIGRRGTAFVEVVG